MSEFAKGLGYAVMVAGALWLSGLAFYGGCYVAARVIDWWKERQR